MITISVVIVTLNRREELMALLADLHDQAAPAGCDITVVDNGSSDGTARAMGQRFPAVRLLRNHTNRGAPAGRNAGAGASTGEILVFLDDDTRVKDPEFLTRVRDVFRPGQDVDVAAFRILDPATQRCRSFEIPRRGSSQALEPFETSYFIAAGCAMRRNVFQIVGGMDESLTYGFEELDFSYRAVARGFRFFYRPEVWVHHGLSTSGRPSWRRLYFFYRNKIWISARYLPWRMFAVQFAVWSVYFLKESLLVLRPDMFLAALASALIGLPGRLRQRRVDRLGKEVISRLRRIHGRLYT